MKAVFLFFLFFFGTSCSFKRIEDCNEIPMLNTNIRKYIISKKCFNESRNIMCVNLSRKKDSLILDIADTYPNIKGMKFNLDTTIYEIRIIFTGERIKGYCKSSPNNVFPEDIVEINKNQRWLLQREATNWRFVYNKNILIRKSLGCGED